MSENGLSMIDLVLTHLDHLWGPTWWFDALKSVLVLDFGHFRHAWKWPFWGELVILGPEEVCLGYLQSLHCPGLGWSGRSGVRSCRTRSHGPKAPRLLVAYNLQCLTLFHVSIINITWFESTGTHMAPTALFRYVHLQLNYAEERDPGMQDVI